ncbi:glycosyltransferase family 2 protein [Methylobacterium sp. BTF04]|uniref:glycosyltransferase n=1 Tax=Methylobacterium sp. BTF04 TaxID=2708300 RepID=UPI0013CFEEFE|nr:glycosyltransferase family 2 protein [Methylobacterium sp. BTF04]NEU13063.1 glycosyltransferase family 2 protein [Methylobacterium sp. BTF04]
MRKSAPSLGCAVVCVPARNEAEILPRLIRSLDAQLGAGDGARLRVVILANNCTDGTVELIHAMERDGEATHLILRVIEARIAPPDAHVGTARRMALDAGADWLDADAVVDGVVLSTDADAVAPADWVRANLAALDGAELVGGRLVIHGAVSDPALDDLHRRIERYWVGVRALEEALDPPAHDPAPRHGDHVAASLAIRADLYRRVGGLPALACGEDNAFVARVRLHGGRVRHCPAVSIAVSDRATGRVEGGMATEMTRRARVAAGTEAYLLPPASHWCALIARRRALREAWNAPAGTETALRALGITPADIAAIDPATCPNAIALVERIEARIGEGLPEPVAEPLDRVLADIEAMLAELHRVPVARVA